MLNINNQEMNMKITEEALTALRPILDENTGKLLRIIFEGFGWGGPKLGLTLEEPEEKDTMEIDGLSLMMTESVKGFSEGQVLDFINDKRGSGFVIQSGLGGC